MTNTVSLISSMLQRQSSNLLQWNGLPFPTQPGQVGGHEGVGKIVKLGADTETSGLKVGDRVGVKWISSACGNCRELLHPSLKENKSLIVPRTLPGRLRRSMLQPESLWILHPRNIPAIRPRSCELRNSHPR